MHKERAAREIAGKHGNFLAYTCAMCIIGFKMVSSDSFVLLEVLIQMLCFERLRGRLILSYLVHDMILIKK